MNKQLLPVLLLLISTAVNAQYSEILNSNRPGRSISAYNVGMNVFQIESGFDFEGLKLNELKTEKSISWNTLFRYASDDYKEFYLQASPKTTFVEIDSSTSTQFQLNPLSLGMVYRFNDNIGWKPAMAIRSGIMYYQDDDQKSIGDIEAIFVTQNEISSKWFLISNWGVKKAIFNPEASFIISLTNSISPKWSWFIENMGKYDFKEETTNKFTNYLNAGIAHLFNNNFQADIFAGTDIGFNNYFISVGISWRPFASRRNYNSPRGAEVVIPPPGE